MTPPITITITITITVVGIPQLNIIVIVIDPTAPHMGPVPENMWLVP